MEIRTALTYDDVLLVPKKSDIKSREDVDISSKLSKNINLKIPLVSANMDTVTEAQMAIAMALAGGIGIIHRFCDITTQVKQVSLVKRKQNIIIDQPFTVSPNDTMFLVKEKMRDLNCKSFLVSDGENHLLGILTHRDTTFNQDEQLLVKDLMTPKHKLITAPYNVRTEIAKELMSKNKIEKLPLVDENFKIKGLITATDIVNSYGEMKSNVDKKGRLLVGAAVGVRDGFMDRVDALVKAETDILVVDIAHGHSINAFTSCSTRCIRSALAFGDPPNVACAWSSWCDSQHRTINFANDSRSNHSPSRPRTARVVECEQRS